MKQRQGLRHLLDVEAVASRLPHYQIGPGQDLDLEDHFLM